MRPYTIALLVVGGASLLFPAQTRSQEPAAPKETEDSSAGESREQADRPGRNAGQRGGFPLPPPPVLAAIDQNNDGEISPEELRNAPVALRSLDKDQDGQLADAELAPDFGAGGGRPAFGGGRRGGFNPFGGGGAGRGGFNPFGGGGGSAERLAPEDLAFEDGVAEIPDHDTFHRLSYRGEEVLIDTFLADLEFIKFTLDQPGSKDQQLYFINTKTHRAHMMFARVAGLPFGRGDEQMKGVLVFRPRLTAPNGQPGLYTFEFEPFDAYSFDKVKTCLVALTDKMPALKGKLGYYPRGEGALARAERDKKLYDKFPIKVYRDEDLTNSEVGYLPLNPGAGFGRLRIMKPGERPSPRDVVLYESLPNEMPRVAGIITAVRQTPLSHVNLRAIQDQVPNSFIVNATEDPAIKPLVGRYVSYSVTADGYRLREATSEEVDSHFAAIRPKARQVPPRDLTVRQARSLREVQFKDSPSVGVKAANLATLHTFNLSKGVAPEGFALPFYFYDEFMKHNGFYEEAAQLLANPKFQRTAKPK